MEHTLTPGNVWKGEMVQEAKTRGGVQECAMLNEKCNALYLLTDV